MTIEANKLTVLEIESMAAWLAMTMVDEHHSFGDRYAYTRQMQLQTLMDVCKSLHYNGRFQEEAVNGD